MELMDLDPFIAASLYQPLQENEVRLAQVEPGHALAPIVVNLVSTYLNSDSIYDAISYVWGDMSRLTPICCNGVSTNITLNLDWALRKVRFADRPRLVWADALCINQNDPKERSEQVALMGRIYSTARFVLACMGQAQDGRSHEIASLLEDMSPIIAQPGRISAVKKSWALQERPYEDRRWEALGAIMRAPWFTRVWVLQEIGLAKNPRVLYGESNFSYRELVAAVGWMRANAGEVALRIGISSLMVHSVWHDWSQDWATTYMQNRLRLVDLLDHGALLHCQDPRDRVYAFLGHPLARRLGQLKPDYAKPKLEVFREATVLLLRDAGVRALSSAEHDSSTISDGTPTWVIRWDVSCTLNNIHIHPTSKFSADNGSGSEIHMTQDTLSLKGIMVDTVEHVFEMDLRPESMGITFRLAQDGTLYPFDSMVKLVENAIGVAGVHDRNCFPTFIGTLCCESDIGETISQRVSCTEYIQSQRSPQPRYDYAKAKSFWSRMFGHCCGRALIVTRNGLYGLAPRIATRGDLCCVVYGSAVPFVLRPTSKIRSTSAVRLVGELFLHGMMQGEAVRLVREGKLQERTFEII